MRGTAAIPLIRQIEIDPVLDVLRHDGAPIGDLLAAAKLPAALENRSDGFVAAHSALRFVRHAADSQGIPDLCWRAVMRSRLEQLGGWGSRVAGCPTLQSAIETFCRLYGKEVSFIELGLDTSKQDAWLWRRRPAHVREEWRDIQGEQFMLAAMIRVVRAAAGPGWVPSRIQLESSLSTWVFDVPELEGTRMDFGAPTLAISLPQALLRRKIERGDGSCRETTDHTKLLVPADSLAGSLQQAISPLLSDYGPSLELAAELTGTRPRTLRRRLTEEGTTWRQVVDRARFDACAQRLRNPDVTLAEIALQLGYSDHAHLTRAFRRWTGECPSEYRRRRLS